MTREQLAEMVGYSARWRVDTLLDKLTDRELLIIEATTNGLCKAKEPEE